MNRRLEAVTGSIGQDQLRELIAAVHENHRPEPLVDSLLAHSNQSPPVTALSTVERATSSVTSRMVNPFEVTGDRYTFSTHATSQKASDIASWKPQPAPASSLWYLTDLGVQIAMSGQVRRLPPGIAQTVWNSRQPEMDLVSTRSEQSLRGFDRASLVAELRTQHGTPLKLPMPERFAAYEFEALSIEIWVFDPDRVHHRWRFDRRGRESGWSFDTLAP